MCRSLLDKLYLSGFYVYVSEHHILLDGKTVRDPGEPLEKGWLHP